MEVVCLKEGGGKPRAETSVVVYPYLRRSANEGAEEVDGGECREWGRDWRSRDNRDALSFFSFFSLNFTVHSPSFSCSYDILIRHDSPGKDRGHTLGFWLPYFSEVIFCHLGLFRVRDRRRTMPVTWHYVLSDKLKSNDKHHCQGRGAGLRKRWPGLAAQ